MPRARVRDRSGAHATNIADSSCDSKDHVLDRWTVNANARYAWPSGPWGQTTAGTPCETCGTPIRKEAYLGGSVYYCESCQPLE
ncbi:MAG: hypothetical protein GF331_16820 [Chitinivibrionales bacterium]|nr:hypothetical protein [Chitinivibrionales bacterium]